VVGFFRTVARILGLVNITLPDLADAANPSMRIIVANCGKLEHPNVSRCKNINTHGLQKVVEGCPNLTDIQAYEVVGWQDVNLMQQLFFRNNLERLVMWNCEGPTDESLAVLIEGENSEIEQ
jgi:F-box/leucine-rich repeat protein 2/20